MNTPPPPQMDQALPAAPAEVRQQLNAAREAVRVAYGVDLDFSAAALSLLDELLRSFVSGLSKDNRESLLDAVGCYFGEVVRCLLNGFWLIHGPQPRDWRIGLTSCFLHFTPVGMAGECLVGCETDQYDGTFEIMEMHHEALAKRLDRAPPVTEVEYYSLSGRLEGLTLVADWLVAKQLTEGEPSLFGEQNYRAEAINPTRPRGEDSHN